MKDHFIIENPMCNAIPSMEFDFYARFYENNTDWRTIIDYSMGVDLCFTEDTVERFIERILTANTANRLPESKAPLDAFFTIFRLPVSEIKNIMNKYSDFIVKKNLPDTMSKYYVLAVLETLKRILEITEANAETYKDKFVIVDIYDSVVGSAYVGIELPNGNIAFRSHSLGEKVSREDVQVSFAEKLPVAYTSFGLVPNICCFSDYIFFPTPGAFLSVNNTGMSLGYVGTEFSAEKISDYSYKRITLKFNFVPVNEKIYKNGDEYETFKNFIEYVENGSMNDPMKHLLKLDFKLASIEITVRGTEEKETADTFSKTLIETLSREFETNLNEAIESGVLYDGDKKDDSKIIVFDTNKMKEVHLRPIYN